MKREITDGIAFYYLSSLIVFSGIWFGTEYLPRQEHPRQRSDDLVSSFTGWDGTWYASIVDSGYSYDPNRKSNIAFFPAYPLAASGVKSLLGVRTEIALLIVSHCCLIAVFVMLAMYVRTRFTDAAEKLSGWTLLAFGFWPTTIFLRMAYSESLFILVTLTTMYGMLRRWRPVCVALLTGLATACRPVGVALIPVFVLYLWKDCYGCTVRSASSSPESTSSAVVDAEGSDSRRLICFGVNAVWLIPTACWGIVAFMMYQGIAFADPLAFVKVQKQWTLQSVESFSQHLRVLLTLEPVWSVYVPTSRSYWARFEAQPDALFSLQFANPIYFVLTSGLVMLGAWKKWLTANEVLLSAGLLLIPYVVHSYQAVMMAQGRYAASVIPVYLVLGQLACRLPAQLAAILLCFGATLSAFYAALFAAWYRMI